MSVPRPRRLGHVNLFVSDLEASLAFYETVAGFEIVRREPEIGGGFLSNGATHHDIGLIQVAGGPLTGRGGHVQASSGRANRPSLNHLAFEMASEADLVARYRAIRRKQGVEIRTTADHIISRSVYLYDPDGNVVELYADMLDHWREVFTLDREDNVSGDWTPGATPPDPTERYPRTTVLRRVDGAYLHPRRIDHAALAVADIKRSVAFYRTAMGLEVVHENEGAVCLAGSDSHDFDLVLVPAGQGAKPGFSHAAYLLADGEKAEPALRRLTEAGIPVLGLDRNNDGGYALTISDPDGLLSRFVTA
jgi:catechol 2,3-dioxygenase